MYISQEQLVWVNAPEFRGITLCPADTTRTAYRCWLLLIAACRRKAQALMPKDKPVTVAVYVTGK